MKTIFHSFIFTIAALTMLSGCGKDGDKTAPVTTEPALTQLSDIVGAPDRRGLVGRQVDINNAPVQGVVGNYVFWAGEATGQIPVVREDKLKGPITEHVRTGEKIRMVGTIQLVSNIAANDRIWETVNATEKAQILSATVYIAADSVQVHH